MTVYFVSRHQGAVEWARREKLEIDHFVQHIDLGMIKAGDQVLGTLPVHMAAAVCAQGAQYMHLVLKLSPEVRGHELTMEMMDHYGAGLATFSVEKKTC